jgi:predicted AlkP superfamily phosphohydrolase/phosphomutase
MFTGCDPGTLGLYGFRHRRPGTNFDQYLPNSRSVVEPTVWGQLSRTGRRVCVIGMPPGYPPPRVNGVYVSDFLTPDGATEYVSPASLQSELDAVAGGYVFDVRFRAEDRARVGREVMEMTRKHFAVARCLWKKEPWDFFAIHEIGPDRIHHALWKFFDTDHPRAEDNPELRTLTEEYYARLDAEIAELLDLAGPDVRVLFVSDHGSQAMAGCFCINEWLIERGYLTLKGNRPPPGTPLEETDVDWPKTTVWGAGGYYARIFYNVRGREPEGCLDPAGLLAFEQRLTQELEAVRKPDGELLGSEVRVPREVYREVRGDAPDLMVYFGDAAWRSAGTVGHSALFLEENDTGPDDAVHSFEGVYVVLEPSDRKYGPGPPASLLDVGPTILQLYGLTVTPEATGQVIPGFF